MVTVMLAGRPMFIDKILNDSNAVLHAFLPGTSGGQGIVDALTGAYVLRPNGQSDLRNTLSFDWPKTTVFISYNLEWISQLPSLWIRWKSPHLQRYLI